MAKKQTKDRLGRVGRVEREQRITKIIQYSLIGILGIVGVVMISGIIISTFITPNVVIASVYEEEITVREYQTQVRYQRAQMVDTMAQYAQLYQIYTDETFQSQIANYLSQLQAQLDAPDYLGELIITQMIDDIIIKREAVERGIVVTEDEIIEAAGVTFGYYPSGYPTFTPAPTSESTETADGEGEGDGEAAVDPTAIPEPTSITQVEFEQAVDDFLAPYEEYGVTEELFFELVETQLYREKLSDELAVGISNMEEWAWARHILVEDEETAQTVLQRLEEGELFEDLAAELSIDPGSASNGGDLDWFNENMMVPEFSEAAFGAEVGEIVGPVESQFGFHIIEVLDKEMRQMSDSDFDYRVNLALIDLVDSIKIPAEEAGDVFLDPDWTKYTPDDPSSLYASQ